MKESLGSAESGISALWDKHLESEFAHRSPEEALATMTDNPRVLVVPTMIGGRGTEEVRNFYANHFLKNLPPDIEVVPVSRTIGSGRLVDELVVRFTHTVQMDWLIPGVPPTGNRIELAMVAVVYFEGDRISAEHLYWDTATLLRQAGVLTDPSLPILGGEHARNMLNQAEPLNQLIPHADR
jgi:carboxymethylenebutenolidase